MKGMKVVGIPVCECCGKMFEIKKRELLCKECIKAKRSAPKTKGKRTDEVQLEITF